MQHFPNTGTCKYTNNVALATLLYSPELMPNVMRLVKYFTDNMQYIFHWKKIIVLTFEGNIKPGGSGFKSLWKQYGRYWVRKLRIVVDLN